MDIQVLPTTLAAFVEFARTPVSMCSAAIVVFLIALWAAKAGIVQARGLDKVGALGNLCFAAPLAVFGALHLSDVRAVLPGVPSYMPWRLFITYFVGVVLLAASLSIAAKIQVRWSGLLFGMMMFLFVGMLMIPRALANPKDRFAWALVFRESAFGGGGWALAGIALCEQGKGKLGSKLITVGCVLVAIAAMVMGLNTFCTPPELSESRSQS